MSTSDGLSRQASGRNTDALGGPAARWCPCIEDIGQAISSCEPAKGTEDNKNNKTIYEATKITNNKKISKILKK